MKWTALSVLLLAILIVGAKAAPYCIFANGNRLVDASHLARCDGVPVMKPVAIFKNKPQTPDGAELPVEILINLYQHPDSIIALGPEKDSLRTFFWQKFIPKYTNGIILVGQYNKADSSLYWIYWEKTAGQVKTSIWLIIAIILLMLSVLLSGLSLRLNNKKMAVATAVAASAIYLVMVPIVSDNMTFVAMFAAVIVAVLAGLAAEVGLWGTAVSAPAKKNLQDSAFLLLTSIILFTIAITLRTTSLPAFVILVAVELIIFFTARKNSFNK